MSANVNQYFGAGRLASDVEVRETNGGKVAKFRFVTNRSWKTNDSDEWKTASTFIACDAWGPLAEKVSKLTKGTEVFLTARLDLDEWEDGEGNKRSAHKLTLNTLQTLSGAGSEDGQQEQRPRARQQRTPSKKGSSQSNDDLPF